MNTLLIVGCLVATLEAKCPRKSYNSVDSKRAFTPSVVTSGPECGPLAGGKTCTDSPNGSCCSSKGFCGNSFVHCSVAAGCWGKNCTKKNPNNYSFDGRCGPKFSNTICPPNTRVGECCSAQGYCGDTYEHCKNYDFI